MPNFTALLFAVAIPFSTLFNFNQSNVLGASAFPFSWPFPIFRIPTPPPTPSLVTISTVTPTKIPTPTLTATPTPIESEPTPTQAPRIILTIVPLPTSTLKPKPTATPKPQPTTAPAPSNSVRDYIMNAINNYRSSKGLSVVRTDPYTCGFADVRAREISTAFNHDGFNNRVSSKTLPYPSYSLITENLATTPNYQNVVNMWINSSGHAANMQKNTPFVCVSQHENYYAYEAWKP